MFTKFVETIQQGKKAAISNFVQDKDLAKSLTGLVEAETQYTLDTARIVKETADQVTKATKKTFEDFTKTDLSKFTAPADFFKAFSPAK